MKSKIGSSIKKYQKGGQPATSDSTAYYKKQGNKAAVEMANATTASGLRTASNKITAADKSVARQKLKGKPGYDANGFPLKKSKMGGSVKKSSKK